MHLDGTVVNSCLVLAVQAVGAKITTIEGLASNGTLDAVQQAFADHFASQCGYCTPGMIMTAKALLADNPKPTEDEIRQAIRGNLCRCTGYTKIVEAIQAASGQLEVRQYATAAAEHNVVGRSLPRVDAPREGHRQGAVRLRHAPARDALGRDPAQPVRPRAGSPRSTRSRPSRSRA